MQITTRTNTLCTLTEAGLSADDMQLEWSGYYYVFLLGVWIKPCRRSQPWRRHAWIKIPLCESDANKEKCVRPQQDQNKDRLKHIVCEISKLLVPRRGEKFTQRDSWGCYLTCRQATRQLEQAAASKCQLSTSELLSYSPTPPGFPRRLLLFIVLSLFPPRVTMLRYSSKFMNLIFSFSLSQHLSGTVCIAADMHGHIAAIL